ncbi:MAG TPA: hypothetical protein DCE23_04425 [Firmicutes bacterium]|nr:hypothetical protein [Bacillota bacterium]
MKGKAIIECVKDFMKKCSILSNDIKVDYLNPDSKKENNWSIEQLETLQPIIKKNVLGTKTTRQFEFILATRTFFNKVDDKTNINNLQMFDELINWFYECTKNGDLPELNDDETALSISCGSGYLYGTDKTNTIARYQCKCKLEYEKIEIEKRR